MSGVAEIARGLTKAAEISPCGLYRYWLGRQWDDDLPRLGIIMLNPSTADADNDDPTIRRCMSFARREGFGGIMVFNLFAFRATSPKDMMAASDPVGPLNDYWLAKAMAGTVPLLAAWGAHGDHRARAAYVRGMASLRGATLVCLGKTSAGHPRHPLYVKGDQPFEPLTAHLLQEAPNNG